MPPILTTPHPPAPVVVGVDIGGTFTDFVVVRGGQVRVYKVPSTPADPSEGFLRGLEELGVPPDARYVHGSTVATNAILERRGARAALLTTDGFRDVLELGRQTRLHLYALTPSKPLPLIPRERCFEVPERVDRHGTVVEPLDEAALEAALDAVQAAGAESLAIVFLFSFARPEHEQRAGERAKARGLSVSLSSEILPEYREYERASTTAANAYVAPLMDRYLRRLDQRLRERGSTGASPASEPAAPRLQIMQSNGGVISVDVARREAVRTVLSGPAGGVVGAWKVGQASGFERLITFDMGGTSTDVSLVEGAPLPSVEGSISGLPIRIPMLDIHTVGAGGGSLVRLDAGGGLRVGPESAGADPGPAAYGRGDQPTVTDANLVLGRLHPGSFVGGRVGLDPERSRAALRPLASRLGLSLEAMAEGVLRIANVQMARALRRVSVERGHDPRRFCLVAFGGGGPLHACDLAIETGIPTILVPLYPGTLSALGMLLSDVQKEYSRTVIRPVRSEMGDLERVFGELEAGARADLAAEGVAGADTELARWIDVRYRGQSYELGLPDPGLDAGAVEAAFHQAHRRRFGYASEQAPCEIVTLRVRATGRVEPLTLPYDEPREGTPLPQATQPLHADGRWSECPVYERGLLTPGQALAGPALLTQEDTTTWIPASWFARVDGWYNVIITRGSLGSERR
ncbi:MAG TPA: hydantoinase/oxoprolinase family protein [Armatimonadota bacterium]|nr:hydantoinase/oxoprolinase family protein [Armatimonadota bacterium]